MMVALFAVLIVLCIVAIIFSGGGKIMVAKLRPGPGADDVSLPFLIFPIVRDTPSIAPPTDAGPADLPDGATVVFRQPADEPMQLLPGRLELLEGENGRKEIRFVSTLGERPKIVVGRAAGPPHKCITLHSPTVSRQHAELEFADGRWTIANLSETNPVLVNDVPVSFGPRRGTHAGTRPRFLSDGDRIALGEVLLRFHAR